jgi:hypothetical protein
MLWCLIMHNRNFNFTLHKISILVDNEYTMSNTYAFRFDSTGFVVITINQSILQQVYISSKASSAESAI